MSKRNPEFVVLNGSELKERLSDEFGISEDAITDEVLRQLLKALKSISSMKGWASGRSAPTQP